MEVTLHQMFNHDVRPSLVQIPARRIVPVMGGA